MSLINGIVQLTDEIETKGVDFEILLSKENVAEVVRYSDLYKIEKAAQYIEKEFRIIRK